MHLFSPAKINLGLQVSHRRPQDGYHYLNSIFVPISFGDDLEVSTASEDSFSTQNELPPESYADFERVSERGDPQANLIYRTLELSRPFRSEALRVHLIKRIPPGSGLGGGSSNAGVLLKHIFQSCLRPKAPCQPDTLYSLALQLGADVSFFLQGQASLVSSIGEHQQPLNVGPGLGILGLSGLNLSSAMAYSLLKRPLQSAPPPKSLAGLGKRVLRALQASQWKKVRVLQNDFEAVIFSSYKEPKNLKDEFFKAGAEYTLMSGSGSSVYALVGSVRKQAALIARMEAKFSQPYRFVPFRFMSSTI